ncbi:MAG: DUF1624 domain-containing protein [Clostridia bacterium]|nr:DUF1624 domain-containing protein [Clostridia bacterium]
MNKPTAGRIWELDLLKGLAFLMMVWDHVVYDLDSLFGVSMDALGIFKEGVGVVCAVIFTTVCGVSVTLGRHNVKHGLRLLGLALALTAGTLLVDHFMALGVTIWFGILHFLGVAMLLGHFIKRLPNAAVAALAVGCFALGVWFETLTVSVPFLFPLGLCARGFMSADFYPLFPHLGYVCVGILLGKTLYRDKRSRLPKGGDAPLWRPLCFLGRHTLLLYFVHQPLVIGLLFLLGLCGAFPLDIDTLL